MESSELTLLALCARIDALKQRGIFNPDLPARAVLDTETFHALIETAESDRNHGPCWLR
jgi:hypothetical protein